MAKKNLVCWSSGKDSAAAFHVFTKKNGIQSVAALLTTMTRGYNRVSMHGVRKQLVETQAAAIGLPLYPVYIEKRSSNTQYQNAMKKACGHWKNQGIVAMVFGDIFLESLRQYREEQLAAVGMKAVFPLWKKSTAFLARRFFRAGFKAVITCVDTTVLDASFAGREYNEECVRDLPAGVDPCGENGEFHSFVYDGPIFNRPVKFTRGRKVTRNKRFCYIDIVPVAA